MLSLMQVLTTNVGSGCKHVHYLHHRYTTDNDHTTVHSTCFLIPSDETYDDDDSCIIVGYEGLKNVNLEKDVKSVKLEKDGE